MIRYLVAAALVMPIAAHAQEGGQLTRKCIFEGSAFRLAASLRDASQSPRQAFEAIHQSKFYGIDDPLAKKIVNLVYFDDRFAQAGGNELSQQITNACLYPRPSEWKPLE